MADLKISELSNAGALDGSESVEIVKSGSNVKTTTQDIADLGGGGPGTVDWGDVGGTLSDQTDLQTALNAKEDESNKAIDFSTINDTLYPSVQAVENRIITAVAGLKWKESVRVATTVAGTLASSFENGDTVDGVVLATGNRILIKNQADQTTNGIYTVNASGAPTRSTDADIADELEGASVTVEEGTSNANTTWLQTTDSITLGVSNIVWSAFGSSVPDADETTKGIVERATDAEVITGSDTTRFVSPASLQAKVIGVQDLFIPAGYMAPRLTGGCEALQRFEMATSLFNVWGLAFDQTTQEFAQFQIVLPRKYNNSTITATPVWTATGGSGTVQWGISFGSYRNDDSLTTAFGTAQTSDDTLLAANDFHVAPDTSAITPSGTLQDGNFIGGQISRNPASDTLTADAILLGLWLHITVDAAKDA